VWVNICRQVGSARLWHCEETVREHKTADRPARWGCPVSTLLVESEGGDHAVGAGHIRGLFSLGFIVIVRFFSVGQVNWKPCIRSAYLRVPRLLTGTQWVSQTYHSYKGPGF